MTEWQENLRYEYDLTPDSVVLDCGGYMGDWAEEIFERYSCQVLVLEPVPYFFDLVVNRFEDNPKIQVLNYGIGARKEKVIFRRKGDMTGAFADEGEEVKVSLRPASFFLHHFPLDQIALLKLNIEGLEFDVLENILDERFIKNFDNLQIQFHPIIPDADKRRDAIRERLAETHEEQWCFPWCWESWRIKS